MRRRLSRHTRHSLLIEEGAEEVDIQNDDRNISISDDIDPELASLMDKYNLFFINGRRYYEFDMTTKLPVLENTIPYLFRYKDIEIYESSWNKMAVRIVEELDKLYPKSERHVKTYVIGRKNWLFSFTKNCAEITCGLYTLIRTAVENRINANKYLEYLLNTLGKNPTYDVGKLLPWSKEIKEKFELEQSF